MAEIADHRAEALEQAFALFNDTSEKLAASYGELERRVADLTRQLAAAHDARLAELSAKEALADRLRNVLEALPGAVLVLDSNDTVADCNAAARDLLDEPLAGAQWDAIRARRFDAASVDAGELRIADGRHVALAIRALGDGGRILLFTDVSEARRTQDQLSRYERLSALGEMSARLAHQLRTPLAVAVLYVSRVAEGGLGAVTAARIGHKALARLKDLERLVDGMLAYARGERDAAARVRVGVLLADVAQSAQARIGANASITIDDACAGAVVAGQREVIAGALLNLVDNALHASGTHGNVRVLAARVGAFVELRVSDDGPGVPSAIGERIFEPFFTTRSGGTGLGLAVARSVAEAHGGALGLAPASPTGGATFVLRLPLAQSATAMPSDSASRGAATESNNPVPAPLDRRASARMHLVALAGRSV